MDWGVFLNIVYIYVQASKCDYSTGSVTPVLVAPAGDGVAQASSPKERCENPWWTFSLSLMPHLQRCLPELLESLPSLPQAEICEKQTNKACGESGDANWGNCSLGRK